VEKYTRGEMLGYLEKRRFYCYREIAESAVKTSLFYPLLNQLLTQ